MEFAIAIFTLGAVLVLIGLVGGDLSYHGLRVPKVGMLPRFTTTITGGVFLTFAMTVWLLTEFGHETVAASVIGPGRPGPTVQATEPVATETTTEPIATQTTSDNSAVTLRITDRLTRGAVGERVTVQLDGQEVGTLVCTAESPDDVLDLAVAPGDHEVTLVGRVWATEDEWADVSGSGQLEASPGAHYALTVSEDGTLGLARAG